MKFTKHFSFSVLFILFNLFCLNSSYAQEINKLIIVNHFDKAITYAITINPAVLPDLPSNGFTLATGDQIQSKVIDLQKEAYIKGNDTDNGKVFFGVEVVNEKLKFHGYIGKNIAYSWSNETIIFLHAR